MFWSHLQTFRTETVAHSWITAVSSRRRQRQVHTPKKLTGGKVSQDTMERKWDWSLVVLCECCREVSYLQFSSSRDTIARIRLPVGWCRKVMKSELKILVWGIESIKLYRSSLCVNSSCISVKWKRPFQCVRVWSVNKFVNLKIKCFLFPVI